VTAALPGLRLGPRWERLDHGGHQVRLRFADEVGVAELGVRRCSYGRLRDSYPLSTHDIELYAVNDAAPAALTPALAELSQAALDADPLCRRVVFAAPVDNSDIRQAAEAAGLRHVVDVDVPSAELSLLVCEPHWVARIDLDRVPGS
jgi:hypothetical protein